MANAILFGTLVGLEPAVKEEVPSEQVSLPPIGESRTETERTLQQVSSSSMRGEIVYHDMISMRHLIADIVVKRFPLVSIRPKPFSFFLRMLTLRVGQKLSTCPLDSCHHYKIRTEEATSYANLFAREALIKDVQFAIRSHGDSVGLGIFYLELFQPIYYF
ncbi:hypothetical protein WN51_14420 [Melipona quadrifasciata]|uniref:Uncharacterized protein n=1 Tax=Melipona quadrifasciata TaxID=166423 RepID=A0A0N0U4Y6_9HYME|nr:hypothetical protein WN51_14420 [Melipona quadrifasciata]